MINFVYVKPLHYAFFRLISASSFFHLFRVPEFFQETKNCSCDSEFSNLYIDEILPCVTIFWNILSRLLKCLYSMWYISLFFIYVLDIAKKGVCNHLTKSEVIQTRVRYCTMCVGIESLSRYKFLCCKSPLSLHFYIIVWRLTLKLRFLFNYKDYFHI